VIAADTSTWIAYLNGDPGTDVELLDRAFADRQAVMVPAVLTELLSYPKLSSEGKQLFQDVPLLEIETGYWQRAGLLRAKILAKGRRARLGDALIAQSCIDRGLTLIARDRDFQAFTENAGLKLA
jgi:predicted nucleic acid-binding protein